MTLFPDINKTNNNLINSRNSTTDSFLNSSIKYLNSLSYFNTNNLSNKTNSSKLQSNSQHDCNEILSCVYIRDNGGKTYKLQFHTTDVICQPVYLEPRTFEETKNDKCVQPHTHKNYIHKFDFKHGIYNSVTKTYELDTKNDNVSIMSNKRPLLKPMIFDKSEKMKKKKKISNKTTNIGKSMIYIEYKNICFQIYIDTIELKSVRLIDSDHDESRKQFFEQHQLEIVEEESNKGTIVVKYKKDVLKFIFTLTDIVYGLVDEKISTGVQVKDNNIYIKSYSEVSDRIVYMPLPKSTYHFDDPMVKIFRKNMDLKLHKIAPAWMEDVRKKRLHDYHKCRAKDPYRDLVPLKQGSHLCFDVNNCKHRAKTGVADKCYVDDDEYENWVISNQKIDYDSLKNKEGANKDNDAAFNKYETTFDSDGRIPDNNLVSYHA